MTMPEVTVLTAVRNGADYLGETIACIQAQTFTNWEYIIVDDASTDDTAAIVEAAIRTDGRLRILRRETAGGPYAAANQGIQEARGKYIVRIDADDLSPKDRIQRQFDFLEQNRRFRACVTFWQAYDGTRLIPGSVTEVPIDQDVFCWYLLLRSPSLHSSVCYQREAILEMGCYRELPLSQDYRLWCELTRRRWLGVMPEVLSYVRTHQKRESLKKGELQRNLALDILDEHLRALSGETWSRDELNSLWTVGHGQPMPIKRGLEMLDRWDRLWKKAHLKSEQQSELERLSAFRRWKHLRGNARTQPAQAVWSAMQHGLSMRKARLRPQVEYAIPQADER
jgi:glycosyltransferase involved in cell wall biosynthesis